MPVSTLRRSWGLRPGNFTRRDLLASQISEVQAVAAYLKAVVELYRLDGSLLQRRGITAPGENPVRLAPAK